MNQKLTLSIEQDAIEKGKQYAKNNNRTLSSMVEDFLLFLDTDDRLGEHVIPISKKLSSLVGIGEGSISATNYRQHLIEKNNV